MNWNNFLEVGPPEIGKPCFVYKPNNKYCKYWVDEWDELWECPVEWSTVSICVGEGWQDEDDLDAITHWKYCEEPKGE